MPPLRARSVKALIVTLFVYGGLVATHRGEFWPFSIYPMFSQAGHPWNRVLVRDVTGDALAWLPMADSSLPGRPFALQRIGIKANDVAALTAAAARDRAQAQQVQALFADVLDERDLLVIRAHGRIQDDQVSITYQPALLLRRDTLLIHPNLAP